MISVIIPTYNRIAFLKESVASVLKQDYFHRHPGEWELLVVDDGSTDGTAEWVEALEGPIRCIRRTHAGVSAARNLGLEEARGDLIAFLDSDDLWETDKIRAQVNLLETIPGAAVCYTEETWIRRGIRVNPRKKHQKYSGWIFDKVLPICLLSLSSAIFRREVFDAVGVFDVDLPACEDYDLGIRIAHRYPFYLIEKPLIVKRGGHPDQLSHRYWGMDRFRIKALCRALTLDLNPEQDRLVREEIVKKCRILITGFRKRGKSEEAEEYSALIRDVTAARARERLPE